MCVRVLIRKVHLAILSLFVCSYQLGLAQDLSFVSLKVSLSFLAPQHLDTGGLGPS
jgi:hypothetical protein